MMDFDRHLEKLALIGGNAILFLAFAVASISFSADAHRAPSARYPDGWRAPQQAQPETTQARASANAWSHSWTESP